MRHAPLAPACQALAPRLPTPLCRLPRSTPPTVIVQAPTFYTPTVIVPLQRVGAKPSIHNPPQLARRLGTTCLGLVQQHLA